MMLSLSKALLAAAVLSLSTGSAYAAKRTADAEDAKFWERHLGLLKDMLKIQKVQMFCGKMAICILVM